MRVNSVNWRQATGVLFALIVFAVLATPSSEGRTPYFDWTYDPIQFDPPEPVRFELDNGMVVYLLPDDQLPVVTMTAYVKTGEVFAPAETAGLGEVTGELLVTGGTETRTPDEVDAAFEFLGIRWRGSIGTETASFSMRCLADDFDTGLELFADLLQHPGFDEAKLQLALDNAKEELRRQNDSPGTISNREFSRLLYGDHPYGRTPTEVTLDAITRDKVAEFYGRFFHPNNVILAVSGKIDESALRAALTGAFGGWARGTLDMPSVPEMPMAKSGYFQINKDINQTNIRFGHRGIDRHDPDRHAVRVMNYILGGGGFTSRMMGIVRSDSGLAYSVRTSFTLSDQPGSFQASCQTKAETTLKALNLMQWVVDEYLAHGVTEEEMATAKESILNSDVFQYVTPVGIVERYALLEYHGFDSDQMKMDVEAIRAVTKADVDAAAREHLNPDNYIILAVGPIEQFAEPLAPPNEVTTIELE